MRAPEGVVQEMSSPSVVQWAGGHDYKTNVAFNCMATSGQHATCWTFSLDVDSVKACVQLVYSGCSPSLTALYHIHFVTKPFAVVTQAMQW